uniref:hypothetical protein n=1 Tax=Ornithobacterium rhinotracheale TaxID=28251 RepID=UPI0039A4E505
MKSLENVFLETNLVDFAHMIQSDEDCKQFLVEYKWREGFQCHKCQHKAFQERKDFSRTCNKCSYTESPTAHTIFHKVKFGLTKSFFIAFEYFKYKNIDATSISKIYDIRKSTAAHFMKKLEKIHCLNPSCTCH